MRTAARVRSPGAKLADRAGGVRLAARVFPAFRVRPASCIQLASCVLLASALSGCVVGPNYVPPEPPPTSGYTQGKLEQPTGAEGLKTAQGGSAVQRFVAGGEVSGQWWTLFHSPALDALVEETLANHPRLEGAQAALDRSFEEIQAQRGTLLPSVTTNDVASYQKAPAAGLQSPLSNQSRYTYALFTPRVAVAYAPDVFGGGQRQIESLEARADNQRFLLEATYITLVTNVVQAAIQEAALQEQIATTRKAVDAQATALDLYRKEFALGQLAPADLLQQQAALAQSQQVLPALQRQLAVQRHLLTALAGRLPSEPVEHVFTFSELRLPTRLPVSLPSELVKQRPDVRAADALVHQAGAEIGVALANRLPQFRVSGDGGASAINLTQLATGPAGFYSIVGAVSAPLFDAGTLFHRQRATEASLIEAEAQYKTTVIAAFQNVADALSALQSDALAVKAAANAEDSASKSFELLRKERTAGSANNFEVLVAQQTYLSGLTNSVQARAAQYADTVALFQALGGGWWNRADVKPPTLKREFFDFL